MVKNREINGTEEIGLVTPTPVTQTPQSTSPVSHNAPVYNQNVHNSVSVAKSCILGYLFDCTVEFVR